MKFIVKKLSYKTLVFDETNKALIWDSEKTERVLDLNAKKKLLDLIRSNKLEVRPKEITVINIAPGSDVFRKAGYLHINGSLLGVYSNELRLSFTDFNVLRNNGGFAIVYTEVDVSEVIFIHVTRDSKSTYESPVNVNESSQRPKAKAQQESSNFEEKGTYNPRYSKSQVVKEQANSYPDYMSDHDNNEFIEGTIRIPIPKLSSNENYELLNRIYESNVQIFRNIIQLNNKFENYSENITSSKNEAIAMRKIEDLNLIIEGLRRERSYLEKERVNVEEYTFNKIKKDLSYISLAIDRHIDLDSFNATELISKVVRGALEEVIKSKDIAKVGKQQIDEILNEGTIKSLIEELSDNLESKVQSLSEIKRELLSLGLFSKVGEK